MGKRDYLDDYRKNNRDDYEERIRRRNPAVIAFVLTLSTILVVGIPSIIALSNIKTGKVKEEKPLFANWELIPEATVAENIVVDESQTRSGITISEGDEDYTHIIGTASDDAVTLGFAGDILFDDNYAAGNSFKLRGNSPYGVIGDSLLEQMKGVDIMMVNNEFPYSDRGEPKEGKAYTFRARPETVSILGEMGVDIVGFANNHCFDYGETAFLDSLTTIKNAGVEYVGAGANLEEASHPVYYITDNGMKLAFICATQIERISNPDTRGATDTSPGVFRCMDDTLLLEKVSEAREKGAFVIVFIHWGTESTTEIDQYQTRQAREIVEAGANMIVGAHPHVLQKIEFIDGVPVFYSLGNYIFNSKTQDTCLILTTVHKDGAVNIRFVPAIQSDCRVNEATGSEYMRIINEMNQMSPGIKIDGNGYITS
jgi:poly-gamma-glutamate synthesis protein (capsule biosynthesis protein)